MPQASSHTQFALRSVGHQAALRRFAVAITILTIVGHAFLGFEQSIAQPFVALATAYPLQLLLEWLYATSNGLRPRFYGGFGKLVDFLLPAHIGALSVVMLLYFNDLISIVAFATAVVIVSKSVLRVPLPEGGSRHVFNPSNLAISTTLLVFPFIGLTMPWQWTTEVSGLADWLFPVVIFSVGTLLHIKYANRIWVIVSFLITFVAQAALRSAVTDCNFFGAIAPATGVAAAIFTFYMLPDPATSPRSPLNQVAFGSAVAVVYMVLMFLHVVFALFLALTIVCGARGTWMYVSYLRSKAFASRRSSFRRAEVSTI